MHETYLPVGQKLLGRYARSAASIELLNHIIRWSLLTTPRIVTKIASSQCTLDIIHLLLLFLCVRQINDEDHNDAANQHCRLSSGTVRKKVDIFSLYTSNIGQKRATSPIYLHAATTRKKKLQQLNTLSRTFKVHTGTPSKYWLAWSCCCKRNNCSQ